jgi:TRAP-type uncharacterized transport system substrate-binding protein
MKFDLLFRQRWLLLYAPILLLATLLLWLSLTQWFALPPKRVTMDAGVTGGGYSQLAFQYRKQLEELGVQVTIVTTKKSHNGLQQLSSNPDIDFALVNGLVASLESSDGYMALAAIEREPLWVLTRLPTLNRLTDLKGLRIGIPAYDAHQESITHMVLRQAQVTSSDVTLMTFKRDKLADALIDGLVDVVILMGSSRNDVARSMIRATAIQILGMDQVGKLLAEEKTLRAFVLPQGVIEFRGDVPSRDLTMVAVDLHLLARRDMHPALQRAIFSAATRIHEIPSFLQIQGEFPTVIGLDFPVSEVTLAASRGKRPWLEELLPYWWAQLAQWFLYAALPILLLALCLLKWIPTLFEWRVNAALQHYYGELKFIETEISSVASERPIEMRHMIQRLDEIEQQVMQLQLPLQHTDRWYTLRSHLSDARERLLRLRAR